MSVAPGIRRSTGSGQGRRFPIADDVVARDGRCRQRIDGHGHGSGCGASIGIGDSDRVGRGRNGADINKCSIKAITPLV